jgi:hypothetical protein
MGMGTRQSAFRHRSAQFDPLKSDFCHIQGMGIPVILGVPFTFHPYHLGVAGWSGSYLFSGFFVRTFRPSFRYHRAE